MQKDPASDFAEILRVHHSVIEFKSAAAGPVSAAQPTYEYRVDLSSNNLFVKAGIGQYGVFASTSRPPAQLPVIRDEEQRTKNASAIAFIDELLKECDQGIDENARREWEEMKASLDAHRSSPRKLFP